MRSNPREVDYQKLAGVYAMDGLEGALYLAGLPQKEVYELVEALAGNKYSKYRWLAQDMATVQNNGFLCGRWYAYTAQPISPSKREGANFCKRWAAPSGHYYISLGATHLIENYDSMVFDLRALVPDFW